MLLLLLPWAHIAGVTHISSMPDPVPRVSCCVSCQERLHRAARESELRRRSTMVVQGVAGGAYGARMAQVGGLDKGNNPYLIQSLANPIPI